MPPIRNIEPQNTMEHTEDRLISLAQAGERLSLSKRAIYRLIAKGDLPRPVKVGGATRLYASDITHYLVNLKSARK
ncbi:excisionase family DNA binding protein [Haloferula luteola]|uniref:Excisionase family DNA binding protein n=2 Tax=Haloferula luteola TaxID=595692 RepID=A0A840VGJ1_9BACT|nr:excisionase family DNA binding protein [Haloferula luteola]